MASHLQIEVPFPTSYIQLPLSRAVDHNIGTSIITLVPKPTIYMVTTSFEIHKLIIFVALVFKPKSFLTSYKMPKTTSTVSFWVCDVTFDSQLCMRIYDNLFRANNEYKWWNKYKVMREGMKRDCMTNQDNTPPPATLKMKNIFSIFFMFQSILEKCMFFEN